MNIYYRYPFIIFFLFFSIGVVITKIVSFITLGLSCILIFIVLLFFQQDNKFIYLLLLLVCWGSFRYEMTVSEKYHNTFPEEQNISVIAKLNEDIWPYSKRHFIATIILDNHPMKVAVFPLNHSQLFLPKKSCIRFVGNLQSVVNDKRISTSFKKHLLNRRIKYVMQYVKLNEILYLMDPPPLAKWISQLRLKLFQNLQLGRQFCEEKNELIAGMILGKKPESKDLKTHLLRTNTIHILAISGLHMGIIYSLVFVLLSMIGLGRKIISFCSIIFIWFFVCLVGNTLPVVRAALMITALLLGRLFDKRTNPYNSVALAAFIMVMYDPHQLFVVGFHLSFVAVTGLIIFLNHPHEILKNSTIQYLLAPVIVWISLWPLISYHFNLISLMGILANLWTAPFLMMFVTIGFFSMISGIFFQKAAILLNLANNCLVNLFVSGIEFLESSFSYLIWEIRINGYLVIMYYFLYLIFITRRVRSSL